MGTNYYRIPEENEMKERKDRLQVRIIGLKLNPSLIESGFRYIEIHDDFSKMSPWEEFIDGTSVHLGKRSSGWKFCWNFHEKKFYSNKEELLSFIRAGRVVEEYGKLIEQEEFIAVVKQLDIGHIEALFKQHDKDESGYLNAAEIRQLAKQLGKVLTAAELTAAVSEMDPSGDGQVDLNEFVLWWRKQSETDSGGVLGDALSSHASALDQEYRWFFAAVDSGDEESDGKISLREFSSFVWAWERQTEYRIGDLVIVWPPSVADPAVYSAQTKGKSGVETPDWQPAVGAAEEDGASTVKDGELTWVKQTEHARRLGALCREPT